MRYRWMYYATGMPGWMRFGFSPGWVGRSPTGLPPAAQYLMQTGQVQQFLGSQMPFYQGMALSKDQEISMLENQAKLIEQQLEQIKKRLEELRK